MCRLLGCVARTPISLHGLLDGRLSDFTALSRKHGDGWGTAWYDEEELRVTKAADAAHASPAYAQVTDAVRRDAMLVHLRWATLGFPVRTENSHPFSAGKLAFAHNGSFTASERLDERIAPEVAPLRKGDTDSERYFLAVLSALQHSGPVDALRSTVRHLVQNYRFSSLNCLLLTPDALYVVAQYDQQAERREKEEHYFRMRYSITPEHVVVASSGWPQEGWETLPSGSLLVIRRASLETEVLPIGEGRAA